jgi:hypothetical protein
MRFESAVVISILAPSKGMPSASERPAEAFHVIEYLQCNSGVTRVSEECYKCFTSMLYDAACSMRGVLCARLEVRVDAQGGVVGARDIEWQRDTTLFVLVS